MFRLPICITKFENNDVTKEYSNIFAETENEIYNKFFKLLEYYNFNLGNHTLGYVGNNLLNYNSKNIKINETYILESFQDNYQNHKYILHV
jgi:hypothetical protein